MTQIGPGSPKPSNRKAFILYTVDLKFETQQFVVIRKAEAIGPSVLYGFD